MKKLSAILLAITLTLTLSACGGNDTASNQSSAPPSSTEAISSTPQSDNQESTIDDVLSSGESSDNSNGADNTASAVIPDLQTFAAVELTLTIEHPTDTTVKIILHDPYLASAYSIEAPMFSYEWQITLEEGMTTVDKISALASTGSEGETIDMSAISNLSSKATFSVDFEQQLLIWELNVDEGFGDRLTRAKAKSMLMYGSGPDDVEVRETVFTQ